MADLIKKYEPLMHLLQIPIVGDINAKTLISYCGSAEAVFAETKSNLLKIPGISNQTVKNIKEYKPDGTVEKELEFMAKNRVVPLAYTDANYPTRLKQLLDSPLLIYTKGSMNFNHTRMVAIVGTRKNTQYGKEITEKLVQELKSYNIQIVSGLAYGIDSIAHKAANAINIVNAAVLAHGLNHIYPEKHLPIAQELLKQGGSLITEYTSQTKMFHSYFPARNRIVAGMVDACIVVESDISGGSIITANVAHKNNRALFAVPGKLGDKQSAGCNLLINQNKAQLLVNAAQIAQKLNWETSSKMQTKTLELFKELNSDEQAIVNVLKQGKMQYDQLLILSQIPMSRLTTALLQLELEGLVHALPGKTFGLANTHMV